MISRMESKPQITHKIEISAKTIIFAVVFLLFLNLLWMIKDLILSLFIAFIITSTAKPAVAWMEKKSIPRKPATILLFAFFIAALVGLVSWIIPLFFFETALLFRNLPGMIERINPAVLEYINLSSLTQYVPNITNQAFTMVKSVFSNFVFLTTTLFFSMYLTVEEGVLPNLLKNVATDRQAAEIINIFRLIEKRLGAWLLGQVMLMVVVGLMTYAGLLLIGVRFALPLAIIAGLLEIVPNLGPTISTIPAFIVGISQSPLVGVSAIALSFIIQQIENNFIVPYVMKRVVGLNPIITLIALIIGGRLFGVLGVLLAIPFTLCVETVLVEYIKKKQ